MLIFNRDKAEAISEHVLPANVIAAIEDRHKHAVEIAALGLPVILFPNMVDKPNKALTQVQGIIPVSDWGEATRELHELSLRRRNETDNHRD